MKEGANAIFLMTTGDYDFDKFVKIGRAVREVIPPDMPLVANTGDFGRSEAKELLDAGFTAIYHVVRLREGDSHGDHEEDTGPGDSARQARPNNSARTGEDKGRDEASHGGRHLGHGSARGLRPLLDGWSQPSLRGDGPESEG